MGRIMCTGVARAVKVWRRLVACRCDAKRRSSLPTTLDGTRSPWLAAHKCIRSGFTCVFLSDKSVALWALCTDHAWQLLTAAERALQKKLVSGDNFCRLVLRDYSHPVHLQVCRDWQIDGSPKRDV